MFLPYISQTTHHITQRTATNNTLQNNMAQSNTQAEMSIHPMYKIEQFMTRNIDKFVKVCDRLKENPDLPKPHREFSKTGNPLDLCPVFFINNEIPLTEDSAPRIKCAYDRWVFIMMMANQGILDQESFTRIGRLGHMDGHESHKIISDWKYIMFTVACSSGNQKTASWIHKNYKIRGEYLAPLKILEIPCKSGSKNIVRWLFETFTELKDVCVEAFRWSLESSNLCLIDYIHKLDPDAIEDSFNSSYVSRAVMSMKFKIAIWMCENFNVERKNLKFEAKIACLSGREGIFWATDYMLVNREYVLTWCHEIFSNYKDGYSFSLLDLQLFIKTFDLCRDDFGEKMSMVRTVSQNVEDDQILMWSIRFFLRMKPSDSEN